MSDQHSPHQLACCGDDVVRTPHLDRLAAEGMLFERAYCAAPLCAPSRMSFLTSRRPSANRVWGNQHILSSATPTWAHAVGAAGYETALIGRMHFVGCDQRHGFVRRPLGEYMAHHPGVAPPGAALFQQIPASTSGQHRVSVEMAGTGRTGYQAFDESVADATCAYLHEQARDDDRRPFAAVAGFMLPHCPFFAPRELFDYYYERVDVPQPTAAELAREPQAIRNFKKRRGIDDPLPEERIRVARAAYFALCEYLDQQVGRILDKLDETGLRENTLVVYCSDHGEMAGEHGCWWKSNYYDGSVRVPLIARLPGVVEAGRRNSTLCNLMDLGPTVIDMAAAEQLPRSDGHSLWRQLTGQADATRPRETFSEHGTDWDKTPSRMIVRGPWKLYKYHDETPPVLFHLEDDPGEMCDLAADPAHSGIRDELLQRLYQNWDPDYVVTECKRLGADMRILKNWGEALRPQHEDTLPVPDVEDVELR